MRWVVVLGFVCVCCGGFGQDQPSATAASSSECDGRAPAVGELVIVAVLANPTGVDSGNEWVRVYVAADDSVSLGGLTLVHSESSGASRRWTLGCQVGGPGDVVEVRPDKLNLYNTDGTTLTLQRDAQVIDSAALPSLATDGTMAVLAGDPSADANDEASAFCTVDADSDAVCTVLAPGDLIISEVLRDPVGADAGHEWIELYAVADASIDGLVATEVGSSTRRWTVSASAAVAAGSYVVLPVGGDGDPRLVGTLSLFNDTATLSLTFGETLIDSVLVDCGVSGTSCGRAADAVGGAMCEINPPSPGEENACD